MEKADGVITWFQSHKAIIGAFFLGLSTIVVGAGNIYDMAPLLQVGGVLALIGTTLVGAGAAKSDGFYKDKTEVIKTQIDRRNPESLIPVKDLQKLLAEEPQKPIWTDEQRAAKRAELKAQGLREGPPK